MEFEPRQSDIRNAGLVFSFLFCTFAGAVTFGFLAAFVISGFRGGLDFLASGAESVIDVVAGGAEMAWRGINGLASPAQ
jgi:hypothetical protein